MRPVVLIRPATPDDLPAITEIYNAFLETTSHEWTETLHTVEERAQWLSAKQAGGWPALVAVDEDDDSVLGWATYGDFRDSQRWPGYRFTVEHSIHVAERAWRRGVGRALVSALVEHARADGKRVMIAAIDSANLRSIDFHAGLGFRQVGFLPGVGDKWGQRLSLVLLQLDLVR